MGWDFSNTVWNMTKKKKKMSENLCFSSFDFFLDCLLAHIQNKSLR